MRTVTIGYTREDGDFAVLATLNNNDELVTAEFFDQLSRGLAATLKRELMNDSIEILERQDAPDYVDLGE